MISEYRYKFKKMRIQQELLELLRDLPVCVGLGVKGDVHKIEQFYSEGSGQNLEMAGFIDLSPLALITGYQMNARGMTPMGVQVLGAILNKCVRIADNKWGYKWSDIPKSLQVYRLGDLKFGHLTYVLTGILVRDLFPDQDIVCHILNGNQWHPITWFYEWILKSVEGVEVQENYARRALTRSQMICALRYRDKRSKLSKIPPPWIVLWSRMVGSWPSITFGGVVSSSRQGFGSRIS